MAFLAWAIDIFEGVRKIISSPVSALQTRTRTHARIHHIYGLYLVVFSSFFILFCQVHKSLVNPPANNKLFDAVRTSARRGQSSAMQEQANVLVQALTHHRNGTQPGIPLLTADTTNLYATEV